jgi:hypothetical protein
MSENEVINHVLPAPTMKDAHVSGMSAYEALVAEAESDYDAYWARLAREFIAWAPSILKCNTCSSKVFHAKPHQLPASAA